MGTKHISVLVSVVIFVWGGLAHAVILADYRDDFQGPLPKPGWSYLWNSAGAVGNPANYTSLLWNGTFYDNDGVPGLPGSFPARFVFLGPTGGHPAAGTTQGAGVDRYAIAAYTLSTGGPTDIIDSPDNS